MANKRISDLTALTTPASGDLIPVVDVSDTTDAATGTTKKITLTNLLSDPDQLPDATSTTQGVVEEATQAEVDAQTAVGSKARLYINPSTTPFKASTTAMGAVEEATQAEVDAGTAAGATGARLFINPSAQPTGVTKSITAGATINGATLPVPVYQNKTDNEFYACDGNDLAALKFAGFAISNGTDGASMTVKFTGIVGGFSALDEGEKYYLSDTVGTIQNSPGTYEVLVGVAISTTELLIQKGKRRASGTTSFTSTTTTVITIGFRPSIVRIFACNSGGSDVTPTSFGSWTVFGGNICVVATEDASGVNPGGATRTTAWDTEILGGSANGHSGIVDTITDTSFRLNNTEDAGATTVYIYWEAEGEL